MVVISSNTASVTGLNQSPVIARRRGIVNFNGGVVYNFRFPFFFFFFFFFFCNFFFWQEIFYGVVTSPPVISSVLV